MREGLFGGLLLALLLAPAAANAQSVAGTVKDTSGGVLPGVTVEAASDALIERVKTVITDDRGAFRIVDLRPGTYTVTFTLPGFSTVRREGLELNTGFTATVDAELRVGSLEETVTVTGASPLVDVQNVRTQNVMTRSTLDALPNAQTISSFSALTLGANVSGVATGSDVGGNQGEQGFIVIHGTRTTDMKYMQNGMNTNNTMASNGGIFKAGHNMNQLAIAEVQMSYSGGGAEFETAGAQFNFIPKDGGNRFAGAGRLLGTNEHFQSDNLSAELEQRGARSGQRVKHIYDGGMALGGPLVRDRLWFFTAHRWWGNDEYQPGAFFNAVQGTLRYEPDLNRRAYYRSHSLENGLNLTWQVTPKDKVTYYTNYSTTCTCFQGVGSTVAPEASFSQKIPARLNQASWTRTQSNRVLLEVGYTFLPVRWHIFHDPPNVTGTDIPVLEQSTGLNYNARVSTTLPYNDIDPGPGNGTTNRQQSLRGSISYVTGTHNFKTGLVWLRGSDSRSGAQNVLPGFGPVSFRFNRGVPNLITQWASPVFQTQSFANIGIYAQDQWTIGARLTLNLGVRGDFFEGRYPDQQFPASTFIPGVFIPGRGGVPSWRDVSPRAGLAIRLDAEGKTALKFAHGRYVQSEGAGFAQSQNPANTIVQSASRVWNDANGDLFPQASELGPLSNAAFGTPVANVTFDDELLNGRRGYTWQSSVVLERELLENVGLMVGYFRTQNLNFRVTDNTLVGPTDYSQFCVTAPTDSRLGSVSGTQVCGLYNINPAQFGRVNNLIRSSENFGDQSELFNGVDMSVNARFGRGGLLQGGISLGRQVNDRCFVVDSPQETYQCKTVGSWWDANGQIKASWSYPLPWDMQFAGVYQNIQGVQMLANAVFTNAQIAPSLGRNLSGCPATGTCTATVSIPLIHPNTMFEDRLTQLDIRFSRQFRFGRVRAVPSFDIYNLMNGNTITARNNTYGAAWGTPTRFVGGRLLKFGVQLDY
ncbi:MAG: TonB-dependent receptor [Acidimicrobiia bacterium]|nr:TonB-dependent receptor [Acidimicrobiia bacterium]